MAEQKRHMDVPKERFLGGASRQRAPQTWQAWAGA